MVKPTLAHSAPFLQFHGIQCFPSILPKLRPSQRIAGEGRKNEKVQRIPKCNSSLPPRGRYGPISERGHVSHSQSNTLRVGREARTSLPNGIGQSRPRESETQRKVRQGWKIAFWKFAEKNRVSGDCNFVERRPFMESVVKSRDNELHKARVLVTGQVTLISGSATSQSPIKSGKCDRAH